MKRIQISIEELMTVLEAMESNGTIDLIIFEHEGLPAFADAEDPDSIVSFATVDEDGNIEEEDGSLH